MPQYAASRPLRIEELELDPPGPGEILVRIKGAGLCHSDLSVMNGDRPRPMPMALGHEAAGVVEGLGDGVNGITRRGGTTITAGLPPSSATWAMSPVNLVAEERTI